MKALALVIGIQCGALLHCVQAHAEGGCPPSMVPFQFAPNQPPSCMPGGGQSQEPRPLPEIWADRFGAIAMDPSRGVLGAANDMRSERAARETALAECGAKGGGPQCKVYQTYKNGCGALIDSSSNGFYTPAAATPEIAKAVGMDACVKAGDTDCRTAYSACSFPVRLQ